VFSFKARFTDVIPCEQKRHSICSAELDKMRDSTEFIFICQVYKKNISNFETTFSKCYLLYQLYKFKDLSTFDEVLHCNSHYQKSAENISCRSDRSRTEVCHSSEICSKTMFPL